MLKGFVDKHASEQKLEVRPMIEFIAQQNKKDLIGVEIGVLHGINAHSILKTLSIKKLYLVDPYITYKEYLDITFPFAYRAERNANNLLAPFKDKIIWIRKFSSEAINEIPDNLDFIYIDGNHAYEYCRKDILLYYPKIKVGGAIGGHDYYSTPPARDVKRAVDEFAAENKLKIYTGGIDWWIVKNDID